MAKSRKKDPTMTYALRNAILESELSYKRLEKETGVIRQSLMAFARGEQSLRLDKADKLAEYFGLEIVTRKAE
jgi:transcriptional regulator with XRE-family HTH domain